MSMLNGRRDEAERTGRKVNVAILGAGSIANTMATTLVKMAEDSRYSSWIHPYAVAARDKGRAEAFAAKYGFDTAYGSYADMAADDNVDLVYIATPHNFHAEQAIMCLKAGRNVLAARANHPGQSLADLYDPDKMPTDLLSAHKELDAVVEAAYDVDFNGDEEKIVAHLFKLYAEKVGEL